MYLSPLNHPNRTVQFSLSCVSHLSQDGFLSFLSCSSLRLSTKIPTGSYRSELPCCHVVHNSSSNSQARCSAGLSRTTPPYLTLPDRVAKKAMLARRASILGYGMSSFFYSINTAPPFTSIWPSHFFLTPHPLADSVFMDKKQEEHALSSEALLPRRQPESSLKRSRTKSWPSFCI